MNTELKEEEQLRKDASNLTWPKTSIVIPAYNEQAGLAVILRKVNQTLDGSFEVLVVDDGSTDNTRQVAESHSCRVIRHAVNRGKGAAVQSGIRAARGDNVIVIDADDTYPVEAVPQIAESLEDFDMVIASRIHGRDNISVLHRFGNSLFRNLIRNLYGFGPQDPLTGLYGVRREHLLRMRLESTDFGIESEIAIKGARMGLSMVDIPIRYRSRIGRAKLRGLSDGYRIFANILKMLALYNPTATFTMPGGLLFAVGITLLLVLLGSPISIGRVTLEVHTLIVSGMLGLAGFQIAVFGFTLNLYGLAHHFTRPDSITRFFMRRNMSRNMSILGLCFLAIATVLSLRLASKWLMGGFGAFAETKQLATSLFLAVFALQTFFSSVFLSIFSAELRRNERVQRTSANPGISAGEAVELEGRL